MQIFDVFITRPFGILLMWIFEFVQSYGLSIIIFTILTKLIMVPLSYKSKKSTMAMSALAPKMKEIQKKYKNDKEKLNMATMELYKKEGINPAAGCLPMLITFPIMFSLYYVVQKPLTFMMGLSTEQIAELGNRLGIAVSNTASLFEIDIASAIVANFDKVKDISPYIVGMDFNFLGLNLAQTPSFSDPSILWAIPILSGLTAYLSSFIMQKLQGPNPATENSSMKMMLFMMPLMSVWFGFALPASLGVYWITGNIMMIVQEFALTYYIRYKQKKKTGI